MITKNFRNNKKFLLGALGIAVLAVGFWDFSNKQCKCGRSPDTRCLQQ